MNLNRIIVVLVVLITGIFVAASGSFAAKPEKPDKCSPWPGCKDDGGDPPPPAECNDPSPSFIYMKEGRRNSTGTVYIASKDNCIHSFIMSDLGPRSTHMTDPLPDGSVNGVFIWSEESGAPNVDQLRRADFSVNAAGELTLWPIDENPLDLVDPGVPEGEFLGYSFDIWGNSDHSELYLVVKRAQGDTSGGGSHRLRIYNVNDLSDKRELYLSQDDPDGYTSNWSCPADTIHPQFVAGCYRPGTPKWNPSGTAIYIEPGELHLSFTPEIPSDWSAALRLQITRGGPISSWGISDPQIVYTGSESAKAGQPAGLAAMPGRYAQGYTDLILEIRNANLGLLDVDYCVNLFNPPISNPDPDIHADLWLDCLVTADPFTLIPFVDLSGAKGSSSWLSPTEIRHSFRDKGVHIYKTNIHTGELTKLVDKVAK